MTQSTDPTWQAFADKIHVDLRSLQRWRKEPGSPEGKDEAAWLVFASTRDRKGKSLIGDDEEPVILGETFAEARTRHQIASADREEYNRDIAKIERDLRRGALVTAKEAKASCAAVRDAFLAVGKQLWGRTDELLGDMPASEKQRIAQAMATAWGDLLGGLRL